MQNERLKVIYNHLQYGSRICPNYEINRTSASTYKYTIDGSILNESQRQYYEENGFILIPKLIENSLLDECKQRFVDLCESRFEKNGMTLMKDVSLMKSNAKGEFLYNKVQDIVWDEIFSKYILHPKLLDYIECFTGPNITAVHSMLINKPPDAGTATSRHPLHQDLHYFPFRPENKIVAAWTAMEPVTIDNGCLFVIPGSHKGELLQHDYPESMVNKAYHGIQGYDSCPRLNLIMEKGDTAFFHPNLIHGSGINITKGFRKAISCHYAASDCHYIDVKGTTQENIANEIESMAARKGIHLSFQDVWKYRARQVRGEAINLC